MSKKVTQKDLRGTCHAICRRDSMALGMLLGKGKEGGREGVQETMGQNLNPKKKLSVARGRWRSIMLPQLTACRKIHDFLPIFCAFSSTTILGFKLGLPKTHLTNYTLHHPLPPSSLTSFPQHSVTRVYFLQRALLSRLRHHATLHTYLASASRLGQVMQKTAVMRGLQVSNLESICLVKPC